MRRAPQTGVVGTMARSRLVLALAAALLGGCDEDVGVRFATFADAERAGAVERGLVPGFVPRAATDIAEAHNIDTNLQRLRFRAPPAALDAMARALVPAPGLPPSGRSPRLPGPWPRALLEGAPAAGPLRGYLSIPTRDGVAFCVAVDAAAGAAFAWTCSGER